MTSACVTITYIPHDLDLIGFSDGTTTSIKARRCIGQGQFHMIYGNKVARQYGVVWTIPEDMRESQAHLAQYNEAGNWELPMPGTFVISPAGIITWVYVDANFTHRVEPAAILAELKKIAAVNLN